MILKVVKVLCFDTLLQVLILKVVSRDERNPLASEGLVAGAAAPVKSGSLTAL